jgi:hypothetical protein
LAALINKGQVYLIGRMKVARIMRREDYDSKFDDADLWPGEEVLIGKKARDYV